eukprot:Hpha_TRINITY_DN34496_c0_g1::TRINITY_DN34496_c0_g1_i1::g.96162::m.96162/K00101/lldD; L-lactate dehydrogenase (cytochrome)
MQAQRTVDFKEVQAKKDKCWMVLGDSVYDLSKFKNEHPGGPQYITDHAGTDATEAFLEAHPFDIIARTITGANYAFALKGKIDFSTIVKPSKSAKTVHKEPVALAGKPPLDAVINLYDFEKIAQTEMLSAGKREGWDYYSSGGDDEITLRENHSAFHRIWMKPRVMVNVKTVDVTTTILDKPASMPVYLSAVAMCGLGHEDGELAWVRGAGAKGIPFMMPSLASTAFADMVGARSEKGVLYFQLYVNPDRAVAKKMVQDAEAAGVQTLFITCDAPQLGNREKDRRNKATKSAAVQKNPGTGAKDTSAGVSKALTSFIDPSLCWDDLAWFRSITKMKIVLKGIQCAEDAVLAAEHGVDGIVCSNHGGRQLDTARSGVEVLPEVMAALRQKKLDTKLEVFVDGGVRRGTDVFKCLALGAKAVGLGRPALYAMAAYGQPGVEKMLDLLKAELEMAMRLTGCKSLDDIKESHVLTHNLKDHIAAVPQDTLMNGVYIPPGLPEYGKAVAAAVRADIEAQQSKMADTAPSGPVAFVTALLGAVASTVVGANTTTCLMRSAAFFLLFLLLHTGSNLALLLGPDTYNALHTTLNANPLKQIAEVYLGLATLIHAAAGLYLTLVYGRYGALQTGKLFFSSLVIVAFLLQHIFTFRLGEQHNNGAVYAEVAKTFADPTEVGLYVLAAGAIGYHLHYGWPKAVRRMGLPKATVAPATSFGQGVVYATCSVIALLPLYMHTLTRGPRPEVPHVL